MVVQLGGVRETNPITAFHLHGYLWIELPSPKAAPPDAITLRMTVVMYEFRWDVNFQSVTPSLLVLRLHFWSSKTQWLEKNKLLAGTRKVRMLQSLKIKGPCSDLKTLAEITFLAASWAWLHLSACSGLVASLRPAG